MTKTDTQLHLNLMGPPEVRVGDRSLTFPTRKTLALLIYLALSDGQQPRDLLATLLWPEASQDRSYASLRNTLGHLQSVLREVNDLVETPCLSVTHDALALNPEADIHVDLRMVERAYAQALADRASRSAPEMPDSLPLLQEAAAYHRGDFLAGFSLSDAPDFDDWADIQREVWRRRLGLILDRLSEIQFARGEFAATAETSAMWIALDALNEVAYRRKMRAHFAAGERGQALETFAACRAILAAELGIEPEPDTEALAARIRTEHPLQRPVYIRPHADTPVAFLERVFGGRAAEYQALGERYKLAVMGDPQVVIVLGEAGIGKTRLVTEFLSWASTQGAAALQGRAFESGTRASYLPLVEAIRPVIDQDVMAAEWIGEAWLAPLSQLLPELRPYIPEQPIEFDQSHLFEALVRLTLALSARSPLILFMDDLQWADRATLDWVLYAVRRWQQSRAPILLLVSLRSEALQPIAQPEFPNLTEWLAQIVREADPYDQELSPLSETDTVQMVLSVLDQPDRDFAEWLFSETHGHPFYLMETLKDLLERRALHPKQRGENQWAFAVDHEHDLGNAVRVPSTVRVVIRSRLSRLSPNAVILLAAAAILEQRLTFEHLCTIANIPEDLGLPALDELVSNRLLLEVEQLETASSYAFANEMIRDVVYTEAGEARRRLFHRRALDLLEVERDSAAVLAHHAAAAGNAEAAFRYSLTAGQEALRLAAASEAQAHLEQARQLALDGALDSGGINSHIRDLYLQLAQAYELSNQPARAQAVCDELRKLYPS